MLHKDRLLDFKDDPESAMKRLFEDLPDGPELDPAKRESKVMGSLDMPNIHRQPVSAGLALIGDAALACDPLPGVGCGFAFQSAEWLAEALGSTPATGDLESIDQSLKAYGRRHRRTLAPHERMISSTSTAKKFDPILKLIYRAAARNQAMANRAMLVPGRWITPMQMLQWRSLLGLIQANLSRSASPLGLVIRPPAGYAADERRVQS
jgi:flavin-dependent dehydrogenase